MAGRGGLSSCRSTSCGRAPGASGGQSRALRRTKTTGLWASPCSPPPAGAGRDGEDGGASLGAAAPSPGVEAPGARSPFPHLHRVLGAYAEHYNRARPHQSLGLQPPNPGLDPETVSGTKVRRRDVLGGLIHEYLGARRDSCRRFGARQGLMRDITAQESGTLSALVTVRTRHGRRGGGGRT